MAWTFDIEILKENIKGYIKEFYKIDEVFIIEKKGHVIYVTDSHDKVLKYVADDFENWKSIHKIVHLEFVMKDLIEEKAKWRIFKNGLRVYKYYTTMKLSGPKTRQKIDKIFDDPKVKTLFREKKLERILLDEQG